jgi:hypothetical protein
VWFAFLILGAFLLRKNSASRSNLLRYASQIPLQSLAFGLPPPVPPPVRPPSLLIAHSSFLIPHFSFLPFPFYLFAVAIRVALIFVLKSELLVGGAGGLTKNNIPSITREDW